MVQEGVVVVAVVEVGQAAPAAALQVLPAALCVGLPPRHCDRGVTSAYFISRIITRKGLR